MNATESPSDILRDLYNREINAGIESDWDGGITVWVGHPSAAKRVFARDEFDLISRWMREEVRRLLPDVEQAP